MKKFSIAIIAFVLLAVGTIFVFAQTSGDQTEGKRGFGKRGHHRGGKMALRGLDLTEEQKTQIKQIRQASREKIKPLREQLKANRQKLQELSANGNFDEAQVTAIANSQAAVQAQLIVEKERVKSQTFQILTPEQRAKAEQLKQQRKERFKNRKNRRGAQTEQAPANE
jgi:protein CpxP